MSFDDPARGLDRCVGVHARRSPCRSEAEQNAGTDGDDRGEREHPEVEPNSSPSRPPAGQEPDDDPSRAASDQDAERGAEQREQEALGEQLTDDAAPRPAPSARRMAISRWRDAARASSRLATLAQAMSSTSGDDCHERPQGAHIGGAQIGQPVGRGRNLERALQVLPLPVGAPVGRERRRKDRRRERRESRLELGRR